MQNNNNIGNGIANLEGILAQYFAFNPVHTAAHLYNAIAEAERKVRSCCGSKGAC